MSDSQSTPEELLKIERSLRGLAPRGGSVDRDALMFAAGRQSAGGARGVWPVISLVMALAGIGLGVGVARYPSLPTNEIAESVKPVVEPELENSSPSAAYLIARDRLLRDGIGALAVEPATGSTHESERLPLRWRPVGDLDELFETNPPHEKRPS